MIPLKNRLAATGGLILVLISGCESTGSNPQAQRIAENQATYAGLSAEEQRGVKAGLIARGQELKTVFLALGKPDVIRISPDGRVTTWTYRNFIPPTPEAQKTATAMTSPRNAAIADPLLDTVDAWRHGELRHDINLDGQMAQKRSDQTWGEYARYRKNRELAEAFGPQVVKILDDQARVEYNESLRDSAIADTAALKLEIVFIEQRVSDAIVDDAYSAFVDVPQ
ncbi:MAG: hypothetical protein R3F03_09320 [Opitutaceae bacterium]